MPQLVQIDIFWISTAEMSATLGFSSGRRCTRSGAERDDRIVSKNIHLRPMLLGSYDAEAGLVIGRQSHVGTRELQQSRTSERLRCH
jgi:hypothetical protein